MSSDDEFEPFQAVMQILGIIQRDTTALVKSHADWKDLALRYQAKAETQHRDKHQRAIRLGTTRGMTMTGVSLVQRAYRHAGMITWHKVRTQHHMTLVKTGKTMQHIHHQLGLGRFRR